MARLGTVPVLTMSWLALAGVMGTQSATPAAAASCSALTSELSRLERTASKSSPDAQKWTTAKKQQSKALSSARRDASYLGCSSASTAECKSLNKKIKRMTSNLAAIERQLKKASGVPQGTSKRLRQVRAEIKRQNCNAAGTGRQANASNTGDQPRSLLARLFAPKRDVRPAALQSEDTTAKRKRTSSRRSIPAGGTFRTLCVRTCDGFFFPVSFSTGKGQFVNDAARCTEICPASETELYVYKNPGGDQSQMMSLAGDLYTDQPFAYRYKSEFVEGCGCRLASQTKRRSGWTELRGRSGGTRSRVFFSDISSGVPGNAASQSTYAPVAETNSTPSVLARVPLTLEQLPAYEDPDTLANLHKGFDASADLTAVATTVRTRGAQNSKPSEVTGDLPLLASRRGSMDPDQAANGAPPVFKTEGTSFEPAPERSAPVRVVGPEYFVAQ